MDNLNEIKETLKDMFKAAITNAKDGDEKGEWITINGTHVFIPEGKTAEDVIKEKGWKEKGEGKEKSDKSQDKGSESELSKLSDDEINEKKGLLISKIVTAQRLDQKDKLKELDKEYDAIVKEQNKRLKSDKQGSEGKKEKGERIIVRGKPLYIPEGKKAQDIIRKEFGNGTEADQAIRDYELLEDIHRTIQNCKPETKEDLKVLKGLKDILEEQ